MGGEAEGTLSGWTVDTLREHMSARLADERNALKQQIEGDRLAIRQQLTDQRDAISGRIVDQREFSMQSLGDMRAMLSQQMADMRTMLNERYETQTKALDAAFKAAEQAVQTALVSAEKAVGKAEAAADKRFESVNEFRKQLADQTATFPTRIEVSTRLDGLSEQVQRDQQRIGELELRLTSRLDTAQAAVGGAAEYRVDQRLGIGQLLQAAAVVLTMIGLIIVAFRK